MQLLDWIGFFSELACTFRNWDGPKLSASSLNTTWLINVFLWHSPVPHPSISLYTFNMSSHFSVHLLITNCFQSHQFELCIHSALVITFSFLCVLCIVYCNAAFRTWCTRFVFVFEVAALWQSVWFVIEIFLCKICAECFSIIGWRLEYFWLNHCVLFTLSLQKYLLLNLFSWNILLNVTNVVLKYPLLSEF